MVETGVEPQENRWCVRDSIAAAALFATTAGVILWQNAHVAVLFDLSYILNTAERIATGQVPYRDFPLAHAPLTFLFQAAIIRLTGRVFFHQVLYAAAVGGLGTVLTWRIALNLLKGLASAWWMALFTAAPLCALGIYCILPTPEYDCDCAFWILVAVWALLWIEGAPRPRADCADASSQSKDVPQGLKLRSSFDSQGTAEDLAYQHRADPISGRRGGENATRAGRSRSAWRCVRGFLAGAALVVPLFFKQNMGLPFLLLAVVSILLVLVAKWFQREQTQDKRGGSGALTAVLAGAGAALLVSVLVLHSTAGIGNYVHWTVAYAGQRRLPGLEAMLGVYRYPELAWMLPCAVAGLILLRNSIGRRLWARIVAFLLLAAPFLYSLAGLFVYYDDADSRGDSFLMIWPVLLLLATALALANLIRAWRKPSLRAFLPLIVLAAVNGTMMSQQLWGSTYAIWPLLALLLAELLAFLDGFASRAGVSGRFVPLFAAFASAAMLVCGGWYTASEERLSYANLPAGPPAHSAFRELAGLATPGPYLPEIDELLRYAQANIPFDDGVLLIPGEEPFYFATGRVARFPVPFFDPTIDPYSSVEIAALARSRNIRWLIVKTDVQTREDPTPDRAELMRLLTQQFTLITHLRGYDVYRANAPE